MRIAVVRAQFQYYRIWTKWLRFGAVSLLPVDRADPKRFGLGLVGLFTRRSQDCGERVARAV
jgi:hypothetical protein